MRLLAVLYSTHTVLILHSTHTVFTAIDYLNIALHVAARNRSGEGKMEAASLLYDVVNCLVESLGDCLIMMCKCVSVPGQALKTQ